MVCKCLIAEADSLERLTDIGRRIKVEVDGDYEWTRNKDEVAEVRAVWCAKVKEIQEEQ